MSYVSSVWLHEWSGQTEVNQAYLEALFVPLQAHVLGLDVAVDVALAVQSLQSVDQLYCDFEGIVDNPLAVLFDLDSAVQIDFKLLHHYLVRGLLFL